ncbi:fungal-specific transcription factor domain-containing protein [Amylocarpus encephaloides]|uniref:Fungal-specific transcription factor domain-containing protein n=1 Tax=Amylocarpus encephaloides TaxID=45428 RepID=A0A9P7YQR7_9HELO|nr:fungal-specific transcription factor domain-containing protein [Amylocarpus encephaloides]
MAGRKETGMGQDGDKEEGNKGDGDQENRMLKDKQGPRKRVSQACHRCRLRKDKCDGKKPACSTCITNTQSCSYDANVKKRGLPEGYVRGLEKLLGAAIRDIEGVEDNMLEALTVDGKGVSPLQAWNDEAISERLVEIWRKSTLFQEFDRLVSSLEPTGLVGSGKRKRADSDSQMGRPGVILGGPASVSMGGTSPLSRQESRPDMSQFSWSEPQPGRGTSNLVGYSKIPRLQAGDPSSILTSNQFTTKTPTKQDWPELPSETWHLLDVYFSYTHSWLPIIEKTDLLRVSYQYSQNHNIGPSSSGDVAALWAVIAYAKFQHRAICNIPRAQGRVQEVVWTAERMIDHARSLIPSEEGIFDLGHVQALLLLTLANFGMDHLSRAWDLIGQAVRLSIDLELDSADPTINPFKPKSRAKHVFLGCFVLDTIIAARMKRRPHLRADDADAVGAIDEDGLEEWDPWTDCLAVHKAFTTNSRVPSSVLSTFNRLVQVLKILSTAICIPRNGNALQMSTSLQGELHVWTQAQSPSLYFDNSARNSEQAFSLLPHQFHLHTTYFTVLATCQMLAHTHSDENVNLELCIRTGRHVSELLKGHLNTCGLLIVPPTYEYFVKSAYDIVSEVRGSIEHTHIVLDDWKHNLDICLDAMGPAWTVFDSLGDAVSNRPLSSQGRRESEVAFDLISGNQQADTPTSAITPQSLSGFKTSGPHCPHPFTVTNSRPRTSHTMTVATYSAHRSQSFGQSSGHGLPQPPMYQDARSVLVRSDPLQTLQQASQPSQVPPNLGRSLQAPRLRFASVDSPMNSQLRSNRSATSDNDTDLLANEFAALDAMKWTGNWYQGLVNLGFTDRDNMNQDFYAFCQEPDPLHQNNAFQQLVANSNAEAINFFDGSGLGGIAMSGLGMGFGEEHEGIVAGHILQSLSAAENRRVRGKLDT